MTDEEFSELAERVQQIDELTEHPGWDFFADRAIHEAGKLQEKILSGRLDVEQYRHDTGVLEGMKLVFRLPSIARGELEQVAVEREQAKLEQPVEEEGEE